MVENMVQYLDDGLTGHIKDIVHFLTQIEYLSYYTQSIFHSPPPTPERNAFICKQDFSWNDE